VEKSRITKSFVFVGVRETRVDQIKRRADRRTVWPQVPATLY